MANSLVMMSLNAYSADRKLVTGEVFFPQEVLTQLMDIPVVEEVAQSTVTPEFYVDTISALSREGDRYLFHLQLVKEYFHSIALKTIYTVRCDGSSDIRQVETTVYFEWCATYEGAYDCGEEGIPYNWYSSGEECIECYSAAEMAPGAMRPKH